MSASAHTGGMLLRHGALEEALRCARSEDERVSAVAAGVLSNLALYAKGEGSGSDVRQRMLEAGVTSALRGLMDHPDRTGLSAAKAAAYLFGGDGDRDHPLLRACGTALGRLCHALQHTLDGKELYGVTFDVFELVLAIRDICVLEENRRILVAEGGVPLLVRIIIQHTSWGLREVLLTVQALTELAEEKETAVIIRGSGEDALRLLCDGGDGGGMGGAAAAAAEGSCSPSNAGHGPGVDWGEARQAARRLLVIISAAPAPTL